VLRFWNHEVLTNIEGVLERILGSTRHPSKSPSSLPSPPRGAKELREGRDEGRESEPPSSSPSPPTGAKGLKRGV
jgi:hypothetical protein